MSDAQVDGGDTGGAIQDGVGGQIDVENAAQAVRWYGIWALVWGWLGQYIYELFDGNAYANPSWFGNMQYYYMPVGMAWLMVSFFDSAFMRAVFRDMVFISVVGSFVTQWRTIYTYVQALFDSSIDNLSFWIWLAIQIVGTVIENVMQILLVPQIYAWSQESDYLDNDKDNSLLSFLI